jgi:hypothetical protein
MGSALDIIQSGNPPRAAYVDFPLGHTSGPPFDPELQYRVVRDALLALESIEGPGEIRHLDAAWPGEEDWRAEASFGAGSDSRSPRDTETRYQTEEDRVLAESAAAE